jgi:hypothetical protein
MEILRGIPPPMDFLVRRNRNKTYIGSIVIPKPVFGRLCDKFVQDTPC